jgi:hypothetical protein
VINGNYWDQKAVIWLKESPAVTLTKHLLQEKLVKENFKKLGKETIAYEEFMNKLKNEKRDKLIKIFLKYSLLEDRTSWKGIDNFYYINEVCKPERRGKHKSRRFKILEKILTYFYITKTLRDAKIYKCKRIFLIFSNRKLCFEKLKSL